MHLHTWEWSRWELIGVNVTSFFDIVGCLSPNKTGIKSAAGPLCTPLLNWIKASFILRYVTCIRNPNLQQSRPTIIIRKGAVLRITKINPYIDHKLIIFSLIHLSDCITCIYKPLGIEPVYYICLFKSTLWHALVRGFFAAAFTTVITKAPQKHHSTSFKKAYKKGVFTTTRLKKLMGGR
jgi:hypothetical protein